MFAFDWLTDPTAWAGLLTLVVLEIVLGIDNLVFIAILADKLPAKERDKARVLGLLLALIMRLALLGAMSWMVKLTTPIVTWGAVAFSWRDIILLLGGAFLLFKATVELHERLEAGDDHDAAKRAPARFWLVVAQIVALDAVFSLDSVITAVGMVDHLSVMMIAVVLAMILMISASRPLTNFVNARPTVVILCLSFLLMIGFSLVAEGFGFHIPKGYLYAAIGFSIMIEAFNQTMRRNRQRSLLGSARTLRDRTALAVINLLGGAGGDDEADTPHAASASSESSMGVFGKDELVMVQGVLDLAHRPVRSIMTPRTDINWIDPRESVEHLRAEISTSEYGSVLGLVTPTDVLEVIAGEFPDEDSGDPAAVQESDGSWLIDASLDLRRVEHLLGFKLSGDGSFSTLAGYVLQQLGRLPREGDSLVSEGMRFEVMAMDGARIERLRVTPVE